MINQPIRGLEMSWAQFSHSFGRESQGLKNFQALIALHSPAKIKQKSHVLFSGHIWSHSLTAKHNMEKIGKQN